MMYTPSYQNTCTRHTAEVYSIIIIISLIANLQICFLYVCVCVHQLTEANQEAASSVTMEVEGNLPNGGHSF